MKKISILGCGWLGLPLAKALLANGFLVKGSTTTVDKITVLERFGIQPFQIVVKENEVIGNIKAFLENSEILIIDIPPKLRGSSSENFISKIKKLLPLIENSSIENVIFISSTAVYAEDNLVATEETNPKPVTESGKQLIEVEQLLLNTKNIKTTILRLGGLIGDDRHPVYFLAGRKSIENPYAPINLIHQKDSIAIILKIIETNTWNEIFNAVTPFHPTRKEYYSQKALEFNLEIPEFDESIPSIGKLISSEKIEKILKYRFQIIS